VARGLWLLLSTVVLELLFERAIDRAQCRAATAVVGRCCVVASSLEGLLLVTVVKSNDLVVDKGDLTNSELSYYY
jgi:hypothetical protein